MQTLTAHELVKKLSDLVPKDSWSVFIPNPGNAGDALINAATWRLLDLATASRHIRRKSTSREKVFIYPGGGNLIPEYDDGRSSILEVMRQPFDRFIILPHTIRGNEDLLRNMDTRFHVFCRDLKTFEHVSQHAPNSNIYLTDDLALSLDTAWMLNATRYRRNLLSILLQPRILKKYVKWRRRIAAIQPLNDSLNLLRVDIEARDSTPRDASQDLSACYGSSFAVRAEAELIGHDFLRVLQRASNITTDRLHVGIGASLLNKTTRIYDNSYGKNRAIWELSMKHRFKNSVFVE
jgi:exopolysaccharide biosynthesis predicted pyruvyltransferase EpsI